MSVKLLTLWVGEPPPYLLDFVGRVREVGIVDWELVLFRDAGQVNQLVARRLGVPCRKADGYALSDVRPMLAELFPRKVEGFEWWGWVELDVVLGDLDRLLPPILDRDAVSFFPASASGPLMLLRNCSECNGLFRRGRWREVLAEPSYCNFEETQRQDGGFTRLLRESGLRTHWDGRFSRWEGYPAGPTPYGCRFDGEGRLLETPSSRELVLYHFNHLKRWPTWPPFDPTEEAT